jgi:2-polyprenyl-6-methoxyphenol hydroxylase-like FAD-dependent oxidoreductase
MSVAGSRVGIVGGSVAGCALAVAAGRLGCDVTVFEASSSELEDRGAGIFIPLPLRQELVARGYLAPDAPYCHPPERLWVTADPLEPTGRVMWRHDFPGAAHNWAVLWRGLRSLVPEAVYRKGRAVTGCRLEAEAVTVVLDDDRTERFDVLVGADGYRSSVRRAVCPDVRPVFAGYLLWRGNYSERLLADPAVAAMLDKGLLTVCFGGGHAIIYLMPGGDGRTGAGERRVNWAIYGSPPAGPDFTEAHSIPPGEVPGVLAARLEEITDRDLPTAWAEVVRAGGPDVLSVQPIYDHVVPSFVTGRVVLVGDAATLSRPHTAGGATKAMQEALAFEAAGSTHGSWPELLAAFDAARRPAATEIVETSRLLGHGLVEHSPDWKVLSDQQAADFIAGLIAGHTLYMEPSAASRLPTA